MTMSRETRTLLVVVAFGLIFGFVMSAVTKPFTFWDTVIWNAAWLAVAGVVYVARSRRVRELNLHRLQVGAQADTGD